MSCLLVTACGNGNSTSGSVTSSPTSTRASAGIAAAGGELGPITDRCFTPDVGDPSAEDTVKIAYVGPDIDIEQIRQLGSAAIETDKPILVINAYVEQVNSQGGINGRCVDLFSSEWDWGLHETGTTRSPRDETCAELRAFQPIVVLSFQIDDALLECTAVLGESQNDPGDGETLDETTGSMTTPVPIPVLAVFASAHESLFLRSDSRLFADWGSYSHMLSVGIETALQAGVINSGDKVGLLHRAAAISLDPQSLADVEIVVEAAFSAAQRSGEGISEDAIVAVPARFNSAILDGYEKDVSLLVDGDEPLDIEDRETRESVVDRLERLADLGVMAVPGSSGAELEEQVKEVVEQLKEIEGFYLDTAEKFKKNEITVVVASADWRDVRRLVRAADQIDWHPKWITNDTHPISLMMEDASERQAANLYQISSRWAVGDVIPDLDRRCQILRDSDSGVAPFAYRKYTDAWNLLTTTCDYLDVLFAAITRVPGKITYADILRYLGETDYQAKSGAHHPLHSRRPLWQ